MNEFVKKILKQIIPNKMVQSIRMGPGFFVYLRRMRSIEKEKQANAIFVLGTPIHTNLGDHLITLAEIKFINDFFPDKKIYEIPTEMYQVYKVRLVNAISFDSLIVINGGGWMGNLWLKEEMLIQDMVSSFEKNKVIIFPQTIYYDKNKKPYMELVNSANKAFGLSGCAVLSVRDKMSYDFAQQNLPAIKTLLIPDIALYYCESLKQLRSVPKKNIVKFCLREDRECSRELNIEEILYGLFKELDIKTDKISTMAEHRVPERKRKQKLFERLAEFAECRIIVTDRLHGMIFSYLVGTPCMIIDNKTQKVSGVYNAWLRDSKLIFPLFENKDISKVKEFILQTKMMENNELEEFDFSDLWKELANAQN